MDDSSPDPYKDTQDDSTLEKNLLSLSPKHLHLTKRIKKTLYYGKLPSTDRPSLPMTEVAVQFYRDRAPKQFGQIDVSYAAFVSRRACISPCSMVLGMIYMDRLARRDRDYLQSMPSADLFLISMMMASKFLYDCGSDEEVFNDEWAQSAQMELDELNYLERTFLKHIDWDLFVSPAQFMDMLAKIEKKIALKQAKERGWFSYTDLCVLTEDYQPHKQMYHACVELFQMLLVIVSAYVVSLLTMIGSTVMVTSLQSQLYLIQELFVKTQNQAIMQSVSVQPEIIPQYHLQRPHHVVDMDMVHVPERNMALETIADQSAVRIHERILGSSLPNGVPILNSVQTLGAIGHVGKETNYDLVCRNGHCEDGLSGCLNMTSLRCRPRKCTLCADSEAQCCCKKSRLLEPRLDQMPSGLRSHRIIQT